MRQECSVCGRPVRRFRTSELEDSPMWIGYFAMAKCKYCDRTIVLLYDERKRFVLSISNLRSPTYDSWFERAKR